MSVLPWSETEAKLHRNTARGCFFSSEFHNSGACQTGRIEQQNCSVCYLRGFESDDDGPNYAGWARVYVEAGEPIPQRWADAFQQERDSDNTAYAHALERSIETFGVKWA